MGRRIWVLVNLDGIKSSYNTTVLRFKRFLPAGPLAFGEPTSYQGHRDEDLVQLYTDPGGVRVLAVASIRLKDPGRAKK